MNHNSKPDFPVKAGPDSGQKRRTGLLWFERIALVSGLVLLLTFAGFKLKQDESSAAGLSAFYQQVQAASLPQSIPPASGPASARAADSPASSPTGGYLTSLPPEFELWSEKRIREHQASLLQEAEPPLGVLRIARLDIEVPVYNGTDEFVLNRGVGRIIGTARMDGSGNLGIAGHRDGFFRGLKDVQTGDVLVLQTIHGAMRYRVDSTVIVDPSDVSVLAPTAERTLTLVTCYPFYFVGQAPKRFIVQATAEPQIAMN
jgi:sortase A